MKYFRESLRAVEISTEYWYLLDVFKFKTYQFAEKEFILGIDLYEFNCVNKRDIHMERLL